MSKDVCHSLTLQIITTAALEFHTFTTKNRTELCQRYVHILLVTLCIFHPFPVCLSVPCYRVTAVTVTPEETTFLVYAAKIIEPVQALYDTAL